MARRRKSRKYGKTKPSLISMVPVAYLGANAYNGYTNHGGAYGAVQDTITALTAFDIKSGTFNPVWAMPFYGTVVGSYVAKKLVGMAGVNRALKGLPFRL